MNNESWPGGKKTATLRFTEGERTYLLKVDYGFHLLGGNRKPYFSITGNVDRIHPYSGVRIGRDCERCGCLHDEIVERLPRLAPLIRWHLADADGLPTHYVENAIFRMEQALRVSRFVEPGSSWNSGRESYDKADSDPTVALDYFRSHVVFGAVPETDTPEALAAITGCLEGLDLAPPHEDPAAAHVLRATAYVVARSRVRLAVKQWAASREAGLLAAMRADFAPFGIDVDAAIAAIRPAEAPPVA